MMQETFLHILLSSAVCECRTEFDIPGLLPWCARHRRHDGTCTCQHILARPFPLASSSCTRNQLTTTSLHR
jgi:hypothetical protein